MFASLNVALLIASQPQPVPLSSFFDLIQEEVNISTRSDLRPDEAPSIISVIASEGAARTPYLTLSEALEWEPSIALTHTINGQRIPVIRGIARPDAVLVMLDGMVLNDPIDGTFAHFDLPIAAAHRTELIRGPGSAIHGAYALAGSINLIPDDGARARHRHQAQLWGGSTAAPRSPTGRLLSHFSYTHNNPNLMGVGLRLTALGGFMWDGADRITLSSDATNVINQLEKDPEVVELKDFPGGPVERTPDSRTGYAILKAQIGRASITSVYLRRQAHPLYSYERSTYFDDRFERTDDTIGSALQYEIQLEHGSIRPRITLTHHRRQTAGDIMGALSTIGDPASPNSTLFQQAEQWLDGVYERRRHHTTVITADLMSTWKLPFSNELTVGLTAQTVQIGGIFNESNFRFPGAGSPYKERIALYDVVFGADGRPAPASFERTRIRDLSFEQPWLSDRTDIAAQSFSRQLRRQVLSAYAQDHFESEHINVLGGVRVDYYSDFGVAVIPRGGVVAKFESLRDGDLDLYFKLLGARAFKPPAFVQLYDQTIVESAGQSRPRGNQALKPPSIYTLEAAATAIIKDLARLSLTGFYSQSSNETVLNEMSNVWQNDQARKSAGLEAEVALTADALSWRLTASFYDSWGISRGVGAPIYPRLQVATDLRYQTGPVELGVFGVLRSLSRREETDPRDAISTSFDLGLRVNWQIAESVALHAQAINLLDQEVVDPTPQEFQTASDIRRSGRTIYAGLSVDF